MTRYLLTRLAQGIVVLVGLTIVTYALERALPGGAARAVLGHRATLRQIAAFNRANDLDRPVIVGYGHYLASLLHGDLGYSYVLNRSVGSVIVDQFPKDVVVVGGALLLAGLFAAPIGLAQAWWRDRPVDHGTNGVLLLLYSIPQYAVGLLLIELLAIRAGVLPVEAPQDDSLSGMLHHVNGLVLPVMTLALGTLALFARYTRLAAADQIASEQVRTARSTGLSERDVVFRYVLRNSLAPVVTIVGLSLPAVFTGGLVVEQLFNLPGLGLTFYNAATQDDFPLILGITLFVGAVAVVGTIAADVAHAWLDPRIRPA